MRIAGRILRPATLAERRLLLSFGLTFVKVGRRLNPFIIARKVRRAAHNKEPLGELRSLLLQGVA